MIHSRNSLKFPMKSTLSSSANQPFHHHLHSQTSHTIKEMFAEPDGSKVFTIDHQTTSNFTSRPTSTTPSQLEPLPKSTNSSLTRCGSPSNYLAGGGRLNGGFNNSDLNLGEENHYDTTTEAHSKKGTPDSFQSPRTRTRCKKNSHRLPPTFHPTSTLYGLKTGRAGSRGIFNLNRASSSPAITQSSNIRRNNNHTSRLQDINTDILSWSKGDAAVVATSKSSKGKIKDVDKKVSLVRDRHSITRSKKR